MSKRQTAKCMMEDTDIEKAFLAEAYRFQEAVNTFGKVVHRIHALYEADKFFDWPTVLLSTLLQTTALSLYNLLPKEEPESRGIIDRRSIATLIRNLVDTHDTLDLLCDMRQPVDKLNLHRDIMGYYLSGRLHSAHGKANISGFLGHMDMTRDWYWKRICKGLPDEMQRKRLKSGESLFYLTRKERLEKCCGENAAFVGKVLSSLSSYVHSVPPDLWIKSLEEAFIYDRKTQGVLVVWLRITNFYFAKSIDIVLTSVGHEGTESFLKKYIEGNRECFRREK
jgi:hypothetical protein